MGGPLTRATLLVLDMQRPFVRAVAEGEQVARRALFAVRAARLFGLRVAFTEQVPAKMGGTLAALLEAGGEDAPVFAKTAFSALKAEGLRDWLNLGGTEHVLLAGVETPICLYQTATEALASDFDVTLLTDAAGARRSADVPPVLDTLRSAGVHCLPTETVFYSVLMDAAAAPFKDFTVLVKQA